MTKIAGGTMVGPIRDVIVRSPRASGWNEADSAQWQRFGFQSAPNADRAEFAHQRLCSVLEAHGARVHHLPADPSSGLDGVYVHDLSLPTDHGLLLLRPGKPEREDERRLHQRFTQEQRLSILGELEEPATAEGGDLLWLAPDLLLAGRGYRTNAAGIHALRRHLQPHGVEVVEAPLPHGAGPAECLHLQSLLSPLDEHTVLADRPLLAVATLELLADRGLDLVDIDGNERATLACNVLALGGRSLLAIEENRATNRRLESRGFTVHTIPGADLCIPGTGGPTCLTRPLSRELGPTPAPHRP